MSDQDAVIKIAWNEDQSDSTADDAESADGFDWAVLSIRAISDIRGWLAPSDKRRLVSGAKKQPRIL